MSDLTLPYVLLTIRRDELAESRIGCGPACDEGLALYDELSGGADEVTLRWDALAAVWSAAEYPSFAGWVRDRFGLRVCAPSATLEGANLEGANLGGANLGGANLRGANLEGARRLSDDQSVLGWRLIDGRLRRAL